MSSNPAPSSQAVLSGYIERSWRFLAELQQSSGMEFVMGESARSDIACLTSEPSVVAELAEALRSYAREVA